eukprot:TRINITY_DN12138_c0_g1_i1.p1 TRINITY_DN12138_c0_g1~~TRINITY_DN12138_c0_g1_i1.p1  ORF type:complete len:331 (+),score=54.46 TRINITY_DN12138_c0_g1_i1:1-993(+)
MGNFFEYSNWSSTNGRKQTPPNALKNTLNLTDRELNYPEEYKNTTKDIPYYLRGFYDFKEDESIQSAVNMHCNLERIESTIFNTLPKNADHFPVRLYIGAQIPKNLFVGLAAHFTQEIGTNHLAVQVCDKIIHWLDNSLVLVHEFSGSNCIAVFYPQKEKKEYPNIPNTEENRLRICQVIQKWNCSKIYSSLNANCQNFTAEIFGALSLDFKFSNMGGPVKDFINFISRPNNTQTLPCFVKEGSKILEWTSHYELDQWSKENPQDSYSELYYLIKGFHRGFQVKKEVGFSECPYGVATLLDTKNNENSVNDEYCNVSNFDYHSGNFGSNN